MLYMVLLGVLSHGSVYKEDVQGKTVGTALGRSGVYHPFPLLGIFLRYNKSKWKQK